MEWWRREEVGEDKDKDLEGPALALLVGEGFALPSTGMVTVDLSTPPPAAKSTRTMLFRKPSNPSFCVSPYLSSSILSPPNGPPYLHSLLLTNISGSSLLSG